MFYVPLDFNNNPTIDALVHLGAYVSAIAQNESETTKQKAPNSIFELNDAPNLQIQVANSQLEKPLTLTTL